MDRLCYTQLAGKEQPISNLVGPQALLVVCVVHCSFSNHAHHHKPIGVFYPVSLCFFYEVKCIHPVISIIVVSK